MSERDPSHDPLDKAYAEAETLLTDEAARVARRAKLLAAVETDAAQALEAPPRSPWARAVWLTAAGIAGVALVVASQSRLTDRFRVQTPPPSIALAAPPAAPLPPPEPARPTFEPKASQAPGAPGQALAAQPDQAMPPPLAAAPVASAPQAFPAPPAATYGSAAVAGVVNWRTAVPPPEPTPLSPPIVTKPAEKVVVPPPWPAPPPATLLAAPLAERATLPQDAARSANDRLRVAAGAGRTADVEALLAQGAPIDAPDEAGDTALMKSIQANHPDMAALLRRRGASLDVKNRAGRSARDMATEIGDAKLNQALGLTPPNATPQP